MRASIIIATYRRARLLEQTLGSLGRLRRRDLIAEVLLIDNGQDGATQKAVRAAASNLPVRLLIEPVPGKNRALNRAVPEARGDLLVFTDDDVVVDPDWLVELVEGAGRWPDMAVFGGRIRPQWPMGAEPPFEHPFWRHAYAIADWGSPEGYYSAGRVFGANMAIRRSVFASGWAFAPELGPQGSDDYIPGGETEFTWRLERSGFSAVYLPRALVFHQIRPEQLELAWLYRRAFRKGRREFQKRPPAHGVRIGGIPTALWYDLVLAFLRFVRSRCHLDHAARFDCAISYWQLRGMVYQCRQAGQLASRARSSATASRNRRTLEDDEPLRPGWRPSPTSQSERKIHSQGVSST